MQPKSRALDEQNDTHVAWVIKLRVNTSVH